ncbi:hypothetical protein LSH36_400g00000 [Paralvinella palmiformis]|uniref:Uncharacterized protein n=1 Tax=Paralvinella palmiformis TaxID=53620 RepID=A0AAD9JCX2_9ANNE|nr:hypothetical protein LSH36_400g00000 [Paralvinella palmiformis]
MLNSLLYLSLENTFYFYH